MAPPVLQSAHRDSLLNANRAVINRIRQSVSPLPAESITRRPPNGGWSVAEVLEHLIVSADSYLTRLSTVLEKNAGVVAGASAMWKPSLMGGLLTESQRSPRKMSTTKMYKPGPSPRPRALDEFVERQEAIGRFIAEAGGIDWQRVRMSSPVISLLRMNLGDAFTLLVVHAERHAAQIERVLEQTGVHAEVTR